MANKIYKLGELIEICDERNTDLKFGIDDVRGISIQKKFIDCVGWASLPTTTAEYVFRLPEYDFDFMQTLRFAGGQGCPPYNEFGNSERLQNRIK